MAIYHQHPYVKSGKRIKRPAVKNDEHNCSNCVHAHKIEDEYDKVYECDAEVYDPRFLTCFVPREKSEE